MAKQVRSWEANDGSLHKHKLGAARRDLEIIVEERFPPHSSLTGHEVTGWLIENRERTIMALTNYHRLAPPTSRTERAPSESPERTPSEGTQAGTRQPPAETEGDMA